jgi:type III restriction enzyme
LLTRTTVFDIISQVSNIDLLFKNPEEYIRSVVLIIESCKNDLLLNSGIEYSPIDEAWEIGKFKDFDSYIGKLLDLRNSSKTLYDYVSYDSKGEKKFAENLELANNVAFFAKLPEWFVIDTFIGEYNPDWAVVLKEDDGHKLYLVRETKFVDDLGNLRPSEKIKIACGTKHFKAIGLDSFKVSTSDNLTDLK